MTDLAEFPRMNAVYAEYFKANPPGRTTVEVKSLPAGAHVEITAYALAGPQRRARAAGRRQRR
jgi:2-iminobutanoate/2-iminopropanoate deaminase